MKKPIFLLSAIFLAFSVLGQVNYEVETGVEETRMNVTAKLDCSEQEDNCPVNSWRLEWRIPENAEIINLSDSLGKISDYNSANEVVTLSTNEGPKRTEEVIRFRLKITEEAEKLADEFYSREVSLPSLEDTETSGKIENKDLISGKVTSGFEKSFDTGEMAFKGEGAANAVVNFGNGSERGEYTFFGRPEGNVSLAYKIAVGTTGLRQTYSKIPVVVLSDAKYDSDVSSWSQGEYSSGVIRIRESTDDAFPAVLTEETVHAFNDESLDFDRTSSSWFDEGIAGYTQSITRKKLLGESKTREIFGNITSYRENREGSFFKIEKPSQGDPDKLWQYYQDDREFMKSWNPRKSENRDFGYAYSELVIRNYVANNNSVRELYNEIEPQILNSNQEKWNYYSQYLDLEPCKRETRDEFDQCLQRLNNYDYPVYFATELPEKPQRGIQVDEVEVPNNSQSMYYRNSELFEESAVNGFTTWLKSVWQKVLEMI